MSADRPTGSLHEGEIIAGRYCVVRLVGRGGMGEVYEAEDQLLHERIALKTVRADRAGGHTLERFQAEIQLARKVTNPNVCRVFEVGTHQSLLFFTMEFVSGETLAARIRREGNLTREFAFPIAIQMAEGLAAAHAAGIVHADFKSGNVILSPASSGERAVITDFGLAQTDASLAPEETRTITERHEIAGTLAYMSPEQMAGEPVTAASDIYSFGIVLFEMATGQLPFDDRHVIQSAMQRASESAIAIRALAPSIDRRWEAAIARCLRKEPRDRFRSAADIAAYLRDSSWRTPVRYWTRRNWALAGLATGLPIATAGGTWYLSRRPYAPQPAALAWYQKGVAALHSMTYETARKALIESVAADSRFALAHASLALAYDELDYSDLAKDSMFGAIELAQKTRVPEAERTRIQALRYMVSRDYDLAAPLFARLETSAQQREKAAAALENGLLAQRRDDTEGATAAFQRAIQLEPGYAAARLRLGVLLGRRGKDDQALQSFSDAENLYNASSNVEGITETLIQRAILLNRRSRAAEALPVIERALTIARAVGNRYQEIELLGWQGVAARIMGDLEKSVALAQQKIDTAIANKMDNLATSGFLDLGDSYLIRGDYSSAESKYHQALDLARRGKVRRLECRALTNLGSLCEHTHRPDESKKFIEAVLPFYKQAGYRRELIQASAILGGALGDLGNYQEGIRTLREIVPTAADLKDRQLEANVRERLAANLRGQGLWPDALAEFERTAALAPAAQAVSEQIECARTEALLGRMARAGKRLAGLQPLLARTQNASAQAQLALVKAEMALIDGRSSDALAAIRSGRAIAPDGDDILQDLTVAEFLAQIRLRNSSGGTSRITEKLARLDAAKLAATAASLRLSTAEALLAAGNRDAAAQWAGQAYSFFEPRGIWESVLRCRLIIMADVNAVHEALTQLKKLWPAEDVAAYLNRPDIRKFARSAGNLVAGVLEGSSRCPPADMSE